MKRKIWRRHVSKMLYNYDEKSTVLDVELKMCAILLCFFQFLTVRGSWWDKFFLEQNLTPLSSQVWGVLSELRWPCRRNMPAKSEWEIHLQKSYFVFCIYFSVWGQEMTEIKTINCSNWFSLFEGELWIALHAVHVLNYYSTFLRQEQNRISNRNCTELTCIPRLNII